MEHDPENSASMWSNKGPLNKDLCVTEGIDDKPTEDVEDYELSNTNTVITLNTGNKTDTMKGDKNDLEVAASCFHKPTEKGKEYKTQLLKQSQMTALSAVSCQCSDIKKLMTDRNNLDVVKTELIYSQPRSRVNDIFEI